MKNPLKGKSEIHSVSDETQMRSALLNLHTNKHKFFKTSMFYVVDKVITKPDGTEKLLPSYGLYVSNVGLFMQKIQTLFGQYTTREVHYATDTETIAEYMWYDAVVVVQTAFRRYDRNLAYVRITVNDAIDEDRLFTALRIDRPNDDEFPVPE